MDAQDYPDDGYEFLTADDNEGLITVRGKDWPEFNLTIKLIQSGNRWLVDGCGIINISKSERSDR